MGRESTAQPPEGDKQVHLSHHFLEFISSLVGLNLQSTHSLWKQCERNRSVPSWRCHQNDLIERQI